MPGTGWTSDYTILKGQQVETILPHNQIYSRCHNYPGGGAARYYICRPVTSFGAKPDYLSDRKGAIRPYRLARNYRKHKYLAVQPRHPTRHSSGAHARRHGPESGPPRSGHRPMGFGDTPAYHHKLCGINRHGCPHMARLRRLSSQHRADYKGAATQREEENACAIQP